MICDFWSECSPLVPFCPFIWPPFKKFTLRPCVISMNNCNGSCNIVGDPFGRIRVLNKIGNVNLNGFNMIKEINESKTLTKHISC